MLTGALDDLTIMNGAKRQSRNYRGKSSLFLSERAIINAINGCGLAEMTGRPFNHMVTIHLDGGGVKGPVQPVVGHYLRMAGQWLTRRGTTPTYLWVLEHAIDDLDEDKGLHVHALVHVPKDIASDFRKLARDRWARLAGIELKRGIVDIRAVGSSKESRQRYYYPENGNTEAQREHRRNSLRGVMRYVLKGLDPSEQLKVFASAEDLGRLNGLDPRAREKLFLTADADPNLISSLLKIKARRNLPIFGRRMSLSENIGVTAILRRAQDRIEALA
jgi:hypothetical protein